MADPEKDADNFVEVDGVKYKEDPEKEGEGLMGDDGELVPFEEKKEEKKEKEEKETEDVSEPQMRKSAKDYIIERKEKKIEKLEKKEEGDGNDDIEEVTPEGKSAIKKEIDKALEPVLNKVRTTSDDQELKDVFAKYPDSKKSEKQIRKYMDNEAYKNVSIEFIYLGLAAKKMDLQKKRDKADEDAKADVTGGHGKRKKGLSSIPDVTDMTDKEVDDLIVKVKTGQI